MSYTHAEWENMQDRRDRRHGTTLFVIHTCGSTEVVKGIKAGKDPNHHIADIYDSDAAVGRGPHADGPHELICWEPLEQQPVADSLQIADPDDQAPHAGIGDQALALYAKGLPTWTRYTYEDADGDKKKELVAYSTPRERYAHWMTAWPALGSPLELLPNGVRNPNECSYSWELVQPVGRKPGGGWKTLPFTDRQHDVLAWRVAQKMLEYKFAYSLDASRRACVGHGDLHPITRYASYGEWDPGGRCLAYRLLFRWDLFFQRLDYWAGCLVP